MTQGSETPGVSARLTAVRRLSPRVLGLTLDAGAEFSWVAGQHVRLSDPEGAVADAYYSIASAWDTEVPGRLELAVTEESYGYPREPGAVLTVTGPLGAVAFDPFPREGELVLIGMGTGISPLRAVLQTVMRDGSSLSVTLVQGARTREECLYDAEFRQMTDPRFRYLPVFSRDEGAPPDSPRRVQDVLSELSLEAHFILCGSLAMTEDVKAELLARGVPPSRIAAEGY